MKDFFEEGPAGVSFRRAGGRIRAELTIGEEPVSPARFLRRVPGATLLHNSVRPDGSVCVARFPALYRNLASLARGGALELYAPPALRNLVELAVPMGFSLRFPYDRAGKRLAIECSEPGFLYDGQGCFLGKAGFIRIAKLEAADPVAEDIRYIPGRHLNLFMRVLLPAIREAVPADCPLNLSPTPPVELAVECWTAEEARLRVRWEVPLSSLTDCGCTGLCLAGNTLYPGDLATYLELPCRYDGVFQLEGAARQAVEHRMATHASLFQTPPELHLGLPVPPKTAGRTRTFSGPALLSAEVTPASKDPPLRHLTFLREARQWADRVGSEAPMIPFSSYWPTYDGMSPGQRDWYFFWRGRVLAGDYRDCSDSYLFVYLYELINGVHGSGEETLGRIYALWEAYRERHPKLDAYLPDWALDYMMVYNVGSPGELLTRFPLRHASLLLYGEVFCNDALQEGLSHLPPDVLLRVAGFEPEKSKVEPQRLVRAVRGLEECYHRRGTELLEAFKPSPRTLTRESFRGAVKGRRANRTISLQYLPYFQQEDLRALLRAALRHGENLLRAQAGLPGRLRVDRLTPDAKSCIEQAVLAGPAAPIPVVAVDVGKAQAIELDSWELTRQLIVEEEPEPEAAAAPVPEANQGDDPFAALCLHLGGLDRAYLRALLAGQPVEALCAEAFLLPDAVAERINEAAAEYLGDALIDAGTGEIYEEYANTLSQALGGDGL